MIKKKSKGKIKLYFEKEIVRCPKCKVPLQKEISHEHNWGTTLFFKVITLHCPSCYFKKKKRLSISKQQYQKELDKGLF